MTTINCPKLSGKDRKRIKNRQYKTEKRYQKKKASGGGNRGSSDAWAHPHEVEACLEGARLARLVEKSIARREAGYPSEEEEEEEEEEEDS
jgi:hypothetical protein